MKRAALAVAAALLLLAADEPAVSPVDHLYVAGETLDFNLTWLRMSGGSARMTIAPVSGDETKLRITSIAQTSPSFSRFYRVRDEIETIVDRSSFSTLHFRKLLHEGKRNKDETTVIDPVTHVAVRRGTERDVVPTPVFDPLSLIYQLRRLDLTPGKVHRFPVYGDGKLYTLEAKVGERVTLQTPAGTFRTVVVQPKMEAAGVLSDEKGRLTLWYSDDPRHLLVRMSSDSKVGAITATLRSVTNGATGVEPASLAESK